MVSFGGLIVFCLAVAYAGFMQSGLTYTPTLPWTLTARLVFAEAEQYQLAELS